MAASTLSEQVVVTGHAADGARAQADDLADLSAFFVADGCRLRRWTRSCWPLSRRLWPRRRDWQAKVSRPRYIQLAIGSSKTPATGDGGKS
jgi:hypothetical protein